MAMTATVERIRVTEAARMLGVSHQRVRFLTDTGRLPAVRDERGERLIDRGALKHFIRARRKRAAAQAK